jgi:hypothetical protein
MKFGIGKFEEKNVKLHGLYLDVATVTNTLRDDVRVYSYFERSFLYICQEEMYFHTTL